MVVRYEDVLELAKQLKPEEQTALIETLRTRTNGRVSREMLLGKILIMHKLSLVIDSRCRSCSSSSVSLLQSYNTTSCKPVECEILAGRLAQLYASNRSVGRVRRPSSGGAPPGHPLYMYVQML